MIKILMKHLNLDKRSNFINSYSFIFSPRPGTVASKLELIDKNIFEKVRNDSKRIL